jgi:hypothetical protein
LSLLSLFLHQVCPNPPSSTIDFYSQARSSVFRGFSFVYGCWWGKKCREEREPVFLAALVMPGKMAASFGFFVREDFKPA